jgi:hypothetical protein
LQESPRHFFSCFNYPLPSSPSPNNSSRETSS